MRYPKRIILCLLVLFLAMAACAANAEDYTFRVDGQQYAFSIPDEYLVYMPEMGASSPLLKLTGAAPAAMDQYLAQLGSAACAVHSASQHQLWISVKDRSAGLGTAKEGQSLPKDIIKAFYDGGSIARGPYTVETIAGRDYYVFADGKSIYEGGINYYISTMMGHYEVSVRWESGTGRRTDKDIAEIKEIMTSIRKVQ